MSDEPIRFSRAGAVVGNAWSSIKSQPQIRFDRSELDRILNIYGRMVVAGEWRDYAIDFLEEVAVFSVFRRTSEMALYRIEKRPKLRNRQGQYAVIAATGLVLKRGHDLPTVLRVLEKKLVRAVETAAE